MNLSDGIAHYLADREAKGIKPGTIRGERNTLTFLLADIGNLTLGMIQPKHLDVFWIRHASWAPSTKNKALAHLSSFVKWCQIRGYIKRDASPLEGLRKFKESDKDRIIIPQPYFSTMIEEIEDTRARALVAIGLYLFTRLSEIRGLRWQDVDLDRNTIQVFREKTGKMDSLPICEELEKELRLWQLAYAAEIGRPLLPSDYVIPHLKQGRMVGEPGVRGFVRKSDSVLVPEKKAHMGWTINKVLKDAGFYQKGEGGHTLRRSGAVALYNQLTHVGHDRSIRIVQAMLGHASVAQTEKYLRLDLDRKVRNDLLAGQPMFPGSEPGVVLELAGSRLGDLEVGYRPTEGDIEGIAR